VFAAGRGGTAVPRLRLARLGGFFALVPGTEAAGLSALASTAQSNGFSSTAELLVANGVSPQMFSQVGRWAAQETAYELKANGGAEPTSTAQQTTVTTAFTKAECTAAKSLNISVSPQFGRVDYTQFTIVPVANTLSQPEGTPTPASTEGLTPAC